MKIKTELLLAVALLVAAPIPSPASAATTPDEAIQQLKTGQARFLAGKPIHPNQDAARRTEVAKGQNPVATILTCSDSRVPAELIFDQGIGDVFVVRVAGNVSDTDEVGTIEYGIGHLNTSLLVVMGHSSCGAVKAVLEGAQVHGSIPELVDNIVPAVAQARTANPGAGVAALLGEAVKTNVWASIDDLFKRSAEVRELVKTGKLRVVGAVYDLATGSVDWLGTHPEQGRLLAYTEGASTHDGAAQGGADAHATTATASHEPAAAKTEYGAAQTPAAANGATEPRLWRWIIGTLVALLVAMGGFWYFARSVMSSWKVPQRIAAGFAMILLVLAGVGVAGYEGLHSAIAGFNEFDVDAEHTVLAAEIDQQVMNMIISAKDHKITGSATYLDDYKREHTELVGLADKALKSIQEPARKQLGRVFKIQGTMVRGI
jgi:carbonic anhydrase